eukprot:9201444-Alexandrium_andersonii.AAC.1
MPADKASRIAKSLNELGSPLRMDGTMGGDYWIGHIVKAMEYAQRYEHFVAMHYIPIGTSRNQKSKAALFELLTVDIDGVVQQI